jgi:hypothetical protein
MTNVVAGAALRKGHARSTDLQQHQPQHQRAEGWSLDQVIPPLKNG